jgi:hypothetical protein
VRTGSKKKRKKIIQRGQVKRERRKRSKIVETRESQNGGAEERLVGAGKHESENSLCSGPFPQPLSL